MMEKRRPWLGPWLTQIKKVIRLEASGNIQIKTGAIIRKIAKHWQSVGLYQLSMYYSLPEIATLLHFFFNFSKSKSWFEYVPLITEILKGLMLVCGLVTITLFCIHSRTCSTYISVVNMWFLWLGYLTSISKSHGDLTNHQNRKKYATKHPHTGTGLEEMFTN